jgi:autotransporter-associated beta strand protein
MKTFFTFFSSFLFASFGVWGQSTVPTTQNLPFSLSSYSGTTFPAGMAVGNENNATDGNFTTDLLNDAPGGIGAGKWNEWGTFGISYLGSNTAQRGSFLLRVASTGLSNITVNWFVHTISSNTPMNFIELQWRNGSSGAWNNVTGDVYQDGTNTSPSGYSVTLPAAANNSNDLRIRWIYYEVGSGNQARLSIDNIVVSGTAPTNTSIAISNGSIASGNINQGDASVVLQRYDLAVTTAHAILNGLTVTTAGTYNATDLTNLEVRYSADATLDAGDAILSTKTTSLGAGTHVFPSFTHQVIDAGTTGYLFVTADIASNATAGNTINVGTTSFSNISFVAGTKTGTNPVAAGGTKTIVNCTTPSVVSRLSGISGYNECDLGWTNGVCYDEMLVVASIGTSISFTPTGNGSAYTANSAYGLGTNVGSSQFVVYKGSGSTVNVTALTNGNTYRFAVYTRKASTWTTAVSTTVILPLISLPSDYFRSNVAAGNWSSASSWQSSTDNNTWITATLSPTSAANTITIRNGHDITVNSAQTADQLAINNGATLTHTSGLTVNNGTGDDVTVESGGTIIYLGLPTYTASSTIRINAGGVLSLRGNFAGNGTGVNASTHIYDHSSILEWNNATGTLNTGVTYFPNVAPDTIPIFRFSTSTGSGSFGTSFTELFLGVLDVASGVNITLTGAGIKTFRNGITGAGDITLSQGQITIDGNNAVLTGSGILTLSAGVGSGLYVSNINTINADKIITGSSEITKAGAGKLTLTGANTYTGLTTVVAGTLQLNRTGGTTIPSTNNVTVIGGTLQISSNQTINSLNISGGNVVVDDGVTLIINGVLSLSSGKITLGTGNVVMGSGASIAGGSSASYIATSNTGALKRVNGGFFPIGTGTTYAPVVVTNLGTADNFTVRVKSIASNAGFTCPSADFDKTVNLEWNVSEDVAGGSNVNMSLSWLSASQGTTFDRNIPVFVSHCNGSSFDYSKSATISGSTLYGASITNVTSFSPFVVSNSSVLPVEFQSIKAIAEAKSNKIIWQIASEQNIDGYNIERSANNSSWETIGTIKAAKAGTYTFEDKSPLSIGYYRVRSIEANGSNGALSKVVSVQRNGKEIGLKVYPQPATTSAIVELNADRVGKVELTLLDVSGRIVRQQTNEMIDGINQIHLDTEGVAEGLYFLKANQNGNQQTVKFIINE